MTKRELRMLLPGDRVSIKTKGSDRGKSGIVIEIHENLLVIAAPHGVYYDRWLEGRGENLKELSYKHVEWCSHL